MNKMIFPLLFLGAVAQADERSMIEASKQSSDNAAEIGFEARDVGLPRFVIGVSFNGIRDEKTQYFMVEGSLAAADISGKVLPSANLRITPIENLAQDRKGTPVTAGYLPIILTRNVDFGLDGRATVYAMSVSPDFPAIDAGPVRVYVNFVVDVLGASVLKVNGQTDWSPEWFRFGLGVAGETDITQGLALRLDLKGSLALPVLPAEALAKLSLKFRKSAHEYRAFIQAGGRIEGTGKVTDGYVEGPFYGWTAKGKPYLFTTAGLEVTF